MENNMITWEDALKLPKGAILYEEQHIGRLILFLARIVVHVEDDELILSSEGVDICIPKSFFPVERLYLEGDD
jgi:hypothetical protein